MSDGYREPWSSVHSNISRVYNGLEKSPYLHCSITNRVLTGILCMFTTGLFKVIEL